MARRRPRGIEYTPRDTDDPKIKLLVQKGLELPEPSERLWRRIRHIAHLGWRLYRARERRKLAERQERKLREAILGYLPEGEIRGFISRYGRPMRVLVALVMGRHVAKPREFLEYLGPELASEIITGVQLNPVIVLDPEHSRRFTLLMEGLFGDRALEYYEILFDSEKLERAIQEERLPEIPEGIFTYTPSHERVLADPVS